MSSRFQSAPNLNIAFERRQYDETSGAKFRPNRDHDFCHTRMKSTIITNAGSGVVPSRRALNLHNTQ
jgi:hypothetical protein